ncbi:putative DnaJ [Ostreococcus tauri]|uniref:Putative DnaJ n=1 Tax=Ostreococcus tauri TaxID=70448 RepID=A0A1Y5I681_OSTTA|nr:putative DnaJ [Ostreococcus tauri]
MELALGVANTPGAVKARARGERWDGKAEAGKDGLGDVPILNPAAFFSVLFGSDHMDGFVGRLQLATLAMAGTDLTEEESDLLQSRREIRLAIKLAAMLDVYVDLRAKTPSEKESIHAEEFLDALKPMAQKLAETSFGTVMLAKIGSCYRMEAKKYLTDPLAGTGTWLDLGVRTTTVKLKQRASSFRNTFDALKAGVSVMATIQTSEQAVAKATTEEEIEALRTKQQLDVLPHVIAALWSTTSVDIERTLRHVGRKVLHDASVSKARRAERAKALAHLGKMFKNVASATAKTTSKDGAKNAVHAVEEALRAALDPEYA